MEQTQFFIKDSTNRIMLLFKDFLDGHQEECDLVIVSSENIELKCHKVVLSLASNFFKNILQPSENGHFITKIILPNYKFETIHILLKFLYCGEIQVPRHLIKEFIELCLEFNLDSSIRDLEEFINVHNATSELQLKPAYVKIESALEIDDSFVVGENKDEDKDIELFVEAGDEFNDEDVYDLIEYEPEKIKYKNSNGIGLNPHYKENLERACNDVIEHRISYLTASRTYGISRSVIHRHVKRKIQKIKEDVNESCKQKSDDCSQDPCEPTKKAISHSKYTVPSRSRRNDPHFTENLQKAVNDVLYKGSSFWSAQKKYTISRSVIHRHVTAEKNRLSLARNTKC